MEIDDAWEIIERVLRERVPQVAATLRGPVTDPDLAALTERMRTELPTDLVRSLRRHDGQDDPARLLSLCDHQTLLGARSMIAASELRAEALGEDPDSEDYAWMSAHMVRTVPNCRGWLPFTDAEGQGWALDLDPLPAGTPGQVIWLPIDGPTPSPEFVSFGAWLADLADHLDRGAFRVHERLGVVLER